MATMTTLKDFLGKVSIPIIKSQDTWSVAKIERLLHDLEIKDYELVFQPKVVKLKDRNQLMWILFHMVPSNISSDYHLVISKFNDTLKLQLGAWQFEAEA